MTQFRPDYRTRYVLALSQIEDAKTGKPTWYRITIPGRPNGRTGWIPAASASLTPVDRWLVIYRGSRKFEFYVNGTLRRTGPVAVGRKGMETPTRALLCAGKVRPDLGGPRRLRVRDERLLEAFGLARGWRRRVHGTNTPELIGQAVSHGCVRLLNKDIQYLRSVVGIGTPIKIVAG